MINFFHYTHALIRKLPDSFANGLKQEAPASPIQVLKAKEQHRAYEQFLRSVIPAVFTLPADEAFPDCCFIEDTAVVAGGRAMITRPGAAERRGEEKATLTALLDLGIRSLAQIEAPGTLDGGDVLFTAREFLVGVSKRTNLEGIEQLRTFFQDLYPVFAVEMARGLHLKSLLSLLDFDTFVISDDPASQNAGEQVKRLLNRPIRVIQVPDPVAANVLRVGSSVLVQAGFPASEKIIRETLSGSGLEVTCLQMSELIKADGALTCCSILC